MSGLGIDTRSDIYSLGVLLYEMLTGHTPLDAKRLRANAYAEMLRIIREEEPPRPSLKISTLGAQATVIARQRDTDPEHLRRDLAGELDWIVMKCLEKDRTRRYETATGLARDIERFLHDEPVEACPPSTWYRWTKFSRRHRGLITTAASVVTLLVASAAVSSWLAVRASRAERRAEAARADSLRSLQNEQAARLEAEAAKVRADQHFERLREATQFANEGVGHYFRGSWAAAYERFARAEELQPDLSTIHIHRGMLHTQLGLWDRAVEDYDRFRLGNEFSSQTLYEHALLNLITGDEPGYRQVCKDLQSQLRNSGGNPEHWLRATVLSPNPVGDPAELAQEGEELIADQFHGFRLNLAGRAHLRARNYEQAAHRLREGLDRVTSTPGGVHRIAHIFLAMALHRQGRTEEAVQALAKAEQAIEEWTKEMTAGAVGTTPICWWDWAECHHYYREAKTLISGTPPAEDPRLGAIRQRALAAITQGDADSFMATGREHVGRQAWDAAAGSFAKVLDNLPQGFRASSQEMRFCVELVQQPEVFARLMELRPRDARLWYARGRTFAARREWSQASADHTEALKCRIEQLQTDQTTQLPGPQRGRAAMMHELAALRALAADLAGYRDLCTAILSQVDEFEDPLAASVLARACTLGRGTNADASILVRLGRQAVNAEPENAWMLHALGVAQFRARQFESAIETLERSLQVHPAWLGRGQNYVVLAMACHHSGHVDESRNWLAKAKESLAEMEIGTSKWQYGLAASDYLVDWLTVLVLLPEAEACLQN